MFIALTNDDGIQAVGLRAMYAALRGAGHEVMVIAPMTEQSGTGHAVTLAMPLRVKAFKERDFTGFGVYGTPTDCVKLGLTQLLKKRPDLVVSGINGGANVGPDLLYSGTVAAATEAAYMGFPALAVSHDSFTANDVRDQAGHAARLIDAIRWNELPRRCVLNLNYPNRPVEESGGLAVCPQTLAAWSDRYTRREDPRGRPYWWLTGFVPEKDIEPGSDCDMLARGYITLTPLRFDFTDRETLDRLDYLKA